MGLSPTEKHRLVTAHEVFLFTICGVRIYPKAAAIFLRLLKDPGQPQARRAQLELGNFVLDGIYSAGDNPEARAQNLESARMIAQELLGQQEYDIAVDYEIGREDLPVDKNMWLYFCKRAAT